MNKKNIVKEIAKKNGLTQVQTMEIVDDFLSAIVDAVAAGERIQFIGFGTFEPFKQKERTVHNLATGTAKDVPEKMIPKFKPSKCFKEAVANNFANK